MSLIKEAVQRAQRYLGRRAQDYQIVFDPESPQVQRVLADLAKFCRAHHSTFHADPRIHAALEGRREVWLRIVQHLNLTSEELWDLYGRKDIE